MSAASHHKTRTDTLIGAGMRIDGRIDFKGVLRVYGDVIGDIASPEDPLGTVVVEQSGTVTGDLSVASIVVKGRIFGTMRAADALEVHPGGCGRGDAFYREIDIRAGGIIDGLLTPETEPRNQAPPAPDDGEPRAPAADGDDLGLPDEAAGAPRPIRKALWIGGALAVLALLVWALRSPTDNAPTPVTPATLTPPTAEKSGMATETPPAVPAPAAAPKAAPATPPKAAEVPVPAVPAAAPRADADRDKVLTVQGADGSKPGNRVFVVTREPVVLIRKKRGETREGMRIEVASGRNIGITIDKGDLVRIAEGRNVDLFYQGRKVPASTIESGVWLGFVAQSGQAAAATE